MLINHNRRRFIQASLAGTAVISLSGAVPKILLGASRPDENQNDNVLVVLQLSGGNDGLNTVIPYGDDEYYKNRFTLAIGRNSVHKIDDHVGFHPALNGMSELLENNQLAVVQGVGYPNPNRSHFESMDLWHTAHQMQTASPIGWLGSTVDDNMSKLDLPALHLGRGTQPLALKTEKRPVPSIRSIDNFRMNVTRNQKAKRALAKIIESKRSTDNTLLSYVHDSANVAIETSHRLEKIAGGDTREFNYPGTPLGRNLGVIANLIESGLSTRIYYVTLEGFDTHSNQAQSHQGLLSELGNSVSAFMRQIQKQGNADRVSVLAFSEFGRRVRENASRGTDHGAAAPLFVCGAKVKSGLVGEHPDLKDLDEGDMKFKIDYRRVYSDLLTNWLNVDAEPIVGGKFESLGLFS
ncbi:MAG: DUF1501 domain-containing protein [Planctomycetota bacterium]